MEAKNKKLREYKKVSYYMYDGRMLFPVGIEQSGKLVVQDENYCLHIVKKEEDMEKWTVGKYE